MKGRLMLAVIGAMLLLSGCNAQKTAAPADEPAAAAPEIVSIDAADPDEQSPADAAPAPAAPAQQGTITFTPIDSGAAQKRDGNIITITGGGMEIAVNGNALTADIQVEEGASLRLILTGGAAFTGIVTGTSLQDVFISLDASSTWTLTNDVAVGGIVDADTSFQNILSGGHAVLYDSEYADNAYLAGAAKKLPGGGFLTPVI